MSKSITCNVDYLNLEIDSGTLRRYEMREQCTQSNEIEISDVSIGASRVSVIPPARPPPLKVNPSTSIDQDSLSSSDTINVQNENGLKSKIKELKSGTKIIYEKMTKAFRKSMLKKKLKKSSCQSPLIKREIYKVVENTTLKNHEDITNANTMRPTSSSPLTMSSSKAVTLNRPCSAKASFRPISNQYSQDFISEQSIWSSYPVMTMIEEFLKEETEIEADENMDELFEHWIKVFISTCHQHIKDIVLNTNNSISQHIDLNGSDLTNGHQNFIKVYTIPTWPQVRLLEDKSKQKYIALKKSHSLSWFVLPRECPKLNQQWVCYPINSMNTFENEFRITEENSIQRMLLRLLALKCFNKIHKNHIVPVNFDINNILLVSSTCGLIMIFKEDKNELDISTFNILKSENLEDIPKQWSIVRNEVKESVTKFFYRLNIISTLISSTWPVDYLAYMLAKLIVETDK